MLARRESVWNALAKAVAGLPARNQVYVAGDFNATLRSSGSLVGPGVVQSATPAADAETLQQIVESWQLIALNTWGPKSTAATFANADTHTQIDFLLTRYSGTDRQARACKIDGNATLFRWRGGGRHFPLMSSLPAVKFLPGRRVQNQAGCDLESLRTAVKRNTPAALHLKQDVSSALQAIPAHDMQKMNDLLFRLVCHHFPARPAHPLPRPWHEQPLQGSIRSMWELHRQAVRWARASHRGRFLGPTIRAWKFYAKFQRMHAEVKKTGTATAQRTLPGSRDPDSGKPRRSTWTLLGNQENCAEDHKNSHGVPGRQGCDDVRGYGDANTCSDKHRPCCGGLYAK